MKAVSLTIAVMALAELTTGAQPSGFLPKHLAVLRAGDGVLSLHLKQSPAFIDQFAPGELNTAPSFTVSIPTNGPDALFFNGHAATEGILTRSADRRLLAVAGYGGVNLLQVKGTPSLLDIARAFGTVDAKGKVQTAVCRDVSREVKMNPRGAATDGTNNFWGCGNSLGTVYYQPRVMEGTLAFAAVPNSRAVKIIGNALYVTLNGADGMASDQPAGIYSFTDASGVSVPLPRSADTKNQAVVAVQAPYTKIADFDMNEAGTIAYTADTDAGIQKYIKTNGAWKFEYNFSIPQNIPDTLNHAKGCFGLVVDFSGPAPVIYATTTEGYNGASNSNRVVQIVDTNAAATVTTLAQAPSAQMVYRGIAFTPEP